MVEAIAAAEPPASDQPLDNRELVEVEAPAGKALGLLAMTMPSTDHAFDQAALVENPTALVEVPAAGNASGLVEAIAAAELSTS